MSAVANPGNLFKQADKTSSEENIPCLFPAAIEQARERLIVALDVPSASSALALVDLLGSRCKWFKVGLELYIAGGPPVVAAIVQRGHSVFLDLKLHDIPNTVAAAVRAASSLGVQLLTIHASGGPAMLAAAREANDSAPTPMTLLAVTVLTSMNHAQLSAAGIPRSPEEQVTILAQMGLEAGIGGFVCSSQEAARLRELAGPAAVLVVPGIRPAGTEQGDQQRIATPAHALRAGASYLVVGRPITQAADPAAAAESILLEMSEAFSSYPIYGSVPE